jgi:hypothetical protein
MSKPFILGFLVALICILPLHAQIAAKSLADLNADTSRPAPAGQAPDDATRKIAELVHFGKYAEAQQLTAGLLVAYPDDQRLIKAKALIEKLLLSAGPAIAAPRSSPPTNNVPVAQVATDTIAGQFTGMDKVDYNALIDLGRHAQQTTDLEQQKAFLKQFMDQSAVFLQKHPGEMLLWQLRVASALSLDDPMAGYEAGQKLLAMGGADSNDPTLQRLLVQVKNKGWLDKKGIEDRQRQVKYAPVLGTWKGSFWAMAFSGKIVKVNDVTYEFSKLDSAIQCVISGAGDQSGALFRGTIIDSGEIRWEILFFKEGWQPVTSWEFGDDKTTMKAVYVNRKNKSFEWSFTKN